MVVVGREDWSWKERNKLTQGGHSGRYELEYEHMPNVASSNMQLSYLSWKRHRRYLRQLSGI